MSFQTQPLDSSNSCSIPIKFVQEAGGYAPINSIEKHLIDELANAGGKSQKQCRICLQGEKEGRMITPCKCIGSVKYTHTKCLTEWIKRKLDAEPKMKVRCQLCDAQFNYRLTQNRIFDCQELKRNYKSYKSQIRKFAITYTIFVVLFIGLIGLLIYASKNPDGIIKKVIIPNTTATVIMVTVIVLYFIILVVIGILFISQYVVRQEISIYDVLNYTEQSYFAKNYRIYFRR